MAGKKILIIKLGAIGDVIHTSIIATAIKQKHPDWKVHYMTSIDIANLVQNHPHIDDFIIWDRARRKSFKYSMEMIKLIYNNHYDIIFNLTHAIRNILFSYLALPKKVVHKKDFNKSWVEDYFLTAKSCIKDLELPERLYMDTNRDYKTKIINFIKNYPRPYFVITPGGYSDKNRQGRIWNINNWNKLCEKLIQTYGGTIFVCGDKYERKIHETLLQDNIVICSGEFNLVDSATLISHADLMISGDTGPAHIASAYDKKILTILGSTSPEKIKPYGKNSFYISSNHDCKYCWKKKCKYLNEGETYTPCMEALSVEEVFDKIKTIL